MTSSSRLLALTALLLSAGAHAQSAAPTQPGRDAPAVIPAIKAPHVTAPQPAPALRAAALIETPGQAVLAAAPQSSGDIPLECSACPLVATCYPI
jgi:hypothetical protein